MYPFILENLTASLITLKNTIPTKQKTSPLNAFSKQESESKRIL